LALGLSSAKLTSRLPLPICPILQLPTSELPAFVSRLKERLRGDGVMLAK
jgi:hypothetical protein